MKLSRDLRNVCEEGGFKLTKWSSNSRAVVCSIPESERSKEVAVLDLEKEDLPSERALGMLWYPEPGDLEALTPNHLLLLKVKPALPPTVAEETGPYVKRRWKQIQYMAEIFWKRWSKEYVTQLQERQKWVLPKPNIKVGDIVLVADDMEPRNQWKMGRVIETLPDQKGL